LLLLVRRPQVAFLSVETLCLRMASVLVRFCPPYLYIGRSSSRSAISVRCVVDRFRDAGCKKATDSNLTSRIRWEQVSDEAGVCIRPDVDRTRRLLEQLAALVTASAEAVGETVDSPWPDPERRDRPSTGFGQRLMLI
jgi:hypothetical protein